MDGFLGLSYGLLFLIFIGLLFVLSGVYTVNTAERGMVERFSKFSRVVGPGLRFKIPFIETVRKLNMRISQLSVEIETKTNDNVFVKIPVAIQYQIVPGKEQDAYYKLASPAQQIESYVYNVILGHVPKMKLDEAFLSQQDIAQQVQQELDATMESYGYKIVKALVTDIVPDDKVKAAMNDINAAQREREAAISRGETEKTLAVKKAEAESESKRLQGEGIANQRKAIISGLQESVEKFQEVVKGSTPNDVMALVLMTQYFDTLKEIGAAGKSNTLLLPHSPSALKDIYAQIREAVTVGGLTSDSVKG